MVAQPVSCATITSGATCGERINSGGSHLEDLFVDPAVLSLQNQFFVWRILSIKLLLESVREWESVRPILKRDGCAIPKSIRAIKDSHCKPSRSHSPEAI